MFPLRDSHKSHKYPLITVIVILVNAFVFGLELFVLDTEGFINSYSLIPANVDFTNYITFTPFITSQFLHAGFLHIISNMWFLKIFGDNVEERFGSVPYLFIYLLSGAVGGLIQYLFAPTPTIPIFFSSFSL